MIPRRASSSTSSAVNGRAALGISALPGSVPKICWYARERPAARRVAVADRLAVRGEVVDAPARRGAATRARAAASRAAGRASSGGRRRRASRSTPVRSSAERDGAHAGRPAGFDEPEAAGHLGREVHADRARRRAASRRSRPGSSPRCSPRRRRRAAARCGRSANVACTTSCVAVRHEQPHVGPAAPAHLGRLVGLERRVERRDQGATGPGRRS